MNAETSSLSNSDRQPCRGCKRLLPRDKLGPMLQGPILMLKRLNRHFSDFNGEASRLYCLRCRWSQTIGVLILLSMFLFVLIAGILQRLGVIK